MKCVITLWISATLILIGSSNPNTSLFGREGLPSTDQCYSDSPVRIYPQQEHYEDGIVVRLTRYHVSPSFQNRFRAALKNYVFSSLKANGNIMTEAYHEEEDTSIFWIVERWSNRNALDKNDNSQPAKKISTLKNGLLSSVEIFSLKDLEPLPDKAYRNTPDAGDDPLTIMLFVDAKEGTEDEFTSRYHAAMPAFRNEPGVVNYQLCQLLSDKTKFITYEKFRSQQAFQTHLKLPEVGPVLQYLQTSIKNPPFENGLHRLIEFAPAYRKP